MSEENVEIVRSFYEAVNGGNVDAALQTCRPDIECQLPDGGINTGTLRGHEALRGALNDYFEAFESFRFDPERFFETDDQVVAYVRMVGRGRSSGLEIERRAAHLWNLNAGKAIRLEVFPEGNNRAALKAAGLRE